MMKSSLKLFYLKLSQSLNMITLMLSDCETATARRIKKTWIIVAYFSSQKGSSIVSKLMCKLGPF